MRRQLVAFAPIVLAFAAVGCGSPAAPDADDQSTLSQLTKTDYACKRWDESRIEAVKAKIPAGFLTGWQGETRNRVDQAIAGVPDVYMDWLYAVHKRNGFKIRGQNPGFSGGVTALNDREPTDMKVMPQPRIVDLTLQHEIGHALNPYVWNQVFESRGAFEAQFGKLADADYTNSNLNAYPRSYPKGSQVYRMEYFAEAFNSYYCSEDTNAMVKEQFPGTYAFLAKHLAKPVWADGEVTTVSSDIALLLGDAGDDSRVWVASSQDVATARLCLGTAADCRQSLRADLELGAARGGPSGRALFAGSRALSLRDGLTVTLLGLDAAGKLKAARTLRIESL